MGSVLGASLESIEMNPMPDDLIQYIHSLNFKKSKAKNNVLIPRAGWENGVRVSIHLAACPWGYW